MPFTTVVSEFTAVWAILITFPATEGTIRIMSKKAYMACFANSTFNSVPSAEFGEGWKAPPLHSESE
jgi:hypothetical protein